MRDEVARGLQASTAAASVRATLGIEGAAADLIYQVLKASEEMDNNALRKVLDRATTTLGLAESIDTVLLPAMRQIGVWWEVGHCDVLQEKMTTEAVRSWIDRRSAFAGAPTHPELILLSCGPTDLHTIGLEALALVLRERGWPCRVLGTRVPTATLTTAAQASRAAAVVVVSHLATGRSRAVLSIEAVHELGTAVFYAGNAFAAKRSRKGVKGTYLGTTISQACEVVLDALGPKPKGESFPV